MLIFVDKRIPGAAKVRLSHYGEVIDFETDGIVYNSISCHPDIFFCQTPGKLVVSPDCPEKYFKLLDNRRVTYELGSSNLDNVYPGTSKYNAVSVGKYLIHNIKYTDNKIVELHKQREDGVVINVRQSYTRCNLIVLQNIFLCSDKGVFVALKNAGLNAFYVDPTGIFLEGHDNGFFGGCCGVLDDKIFIIGSLKHINESKKLTDILTSNNIKIVELVDGRLFDGGGILFVDDTKI
jgi:hypothetical protein